MKTIYQLVLIIAVALGIVSCQDKSYDIAAPVIAPLEASSINGSLDGDDYVWTWTGASDLKMLVSVYLGNTLSTICMCLN